MAVELGMSPVDLQVPPDVAELWSQRCDEIVKYPDPVLRRVASPIERPGRATRELADRMKTAMLQANGMGLAAPQIGILERLIVYRLPEENAPLRVLVNPKIISAKGRQLGPEGCLSLPMLQGDVERANEVVVKAMDILGRPFRRRASGLEARVMQHEIDHLEGVLFIDRADLDTLRWHLPGDPDEDEIDEMPSD
jgi:peptide deformylase